MFLGLHHRLYLNYFILFSWRKFAFSVYQYFSVKSDTVNSYLSAFGLFLLHFSHAADRYFLVLLAGCSVTVLLSTGNGFVLSSLEPGTLAHSFMLETFVGLMSQSHQLTIEFFLPVSIFPCYDWKVNLLCN